MTNINGKDSYINENGYIVNRNGSKQGTGSLLY